MLKKILLPIFAISAIACSNDSPDTLGGSGTGNGTGSGNNGGGGLVISTAPGQFGGAGGNPTGPGALNFVVRDFKFYSPQDSNTNEDFENIPKTVDGQGNPVSAGSYPGPWNDLDIVTDRLDGDHKPVYKNANGKTLTTHGKKFFDQWFRNTDKVNITKTIPVTLTKNAQGLYEYDSSKPGELNKNGMFFPIDDGTPYETAFHNQGKDGSGNSHNFSFTLEIHTVFTYQGGEHFFFRGDDDVFVYVDNKLVINLGGIHGTLEKDVDIDALGLTKDNTYTLDFFYAERHVVASDLLITTGLELSNNGEVPIL